MVSFLKDNIKETPTPECSSELAGPIVLLPLKAHKQSEQFSMLLVLAMLIKQNKFNIVHGEYEHSPYYPIRDMREYYRVELPNGKTIYEITRENNDDSRYYLKINTPTQCVNYTPEKPFMYSRQLFELAATGKLSPDSVSKLGNLAKDGQPLHYLASLMVCSK